MAYRRKRYSRRNTFGSVVTDAAYVSSRVSFRGALLLGLSIFIVFYVLLPIFMHGLQSPPADPSNPTSVALANFTHELMEKRLVRPCRWVGKVGFMVCVLVAIWKHFKQAPMTHNEVGGAGWIARLLSRFFN